MPRTALDRAERLFAAGRYTACIALLEPQVTIYRESQRFYHLLGVSCLYNGDSGGSYTYLKRAEQISPANLDTILALAALHIRRAEIDKAVSAYLRVLEDRPKDLLAKKGLAILRREGSPERLAALVESGRIKVLFPGSSILPRFIRPLVALTIVAIAGFLLWPTAGMFLATMVERRSLRPEVAAIMLDSAERAAPVGSGGSFRYVLTEKEAIAAFERAKAFFQEYRDNAAIVEINRLLGSNASPAVKDKSKALKGFVGAPDFRTVRDAPTVAEVIRDPALYDGCAVIWRGMAANVQQKGNSVSFDFLVGYHEKKRLEGILPSRIKDAMVPLDRALEILAVVRAVGNGTELDCIAIHELPGGR
jgi:tetratricopeptide (TPR) repeat protein